MNEIPSSTPRRWPVFSSAALLVAALPLVIAACAYLSSGLAPSSHSGGGPEVGPQLGGVIYYIIFLVVLFALGLGSTIIALLRREQPVWVRETALAIYGVSALGVTAALIVWWVGTLRV